MATLAILENAEIDREFPPSGDQAIRRNPDAPKTRAGTPGFSQVAGVKLFLNTVQPWRWYGGTSRYTYPAKKVGSGRNVTVLGSHDRMKDLNELVLEDQVT